MMPVQISRSGSPSGSASSGVARLQPAFGRRPRFCSRAAMKRSSPTLKRFTSASPPRALTRSKAMRMVAGFSPSSSRSRKAAALSDWASRAAFSSDPLDLQTRELAQRELLSLRRLVEHVGADLGNPQGTLLIRKTGPDGIQSPPRTDVGRLGSAAVTQARFGSSSRRTTGSPGSPGVGAGARRTLGRRRRRDRPS